MRVAIKELELHHEKEHTRAPTFRDFMRTGIAHYLEQAGLKAMPEPNELPATNVVELSKRTGA
jgi:hypothetical protein